MKKLITLLIIIIYSYSYSQFRQDESNSKNHDRLLQSYIIGDWTHVQSTYPSGNQDYYNKTFTLSYDSSWMCIELLELSLDTVITYGYWYVRDTSIYLYTIIDTSIILGDVSKIEHVEDSLMFLKRSWGLEEARKTSMYKRIY